MSEPNKEALSFCQRLCEVRAQQFDILRAVMAAARSRDEMTCIANLIAQDAELELALTRLMRKLGDDSE